MLSSLFFYSRSSLLSMLLFLHGFTSTAPTSWRPEKWLTVWRRTTTWYGLSFSCSFPQVTCNRVPLVPKLAPNVNSFDMFLKLSEEIFVEGSKMAVLFYCQSGRGRTTFSIVMFGLIHRILYSRKIMEPIGVSTPISPDVIRRSSTGKKAST